MRLSPSETVGFIGRSASISAAVSLQVRLQNSIRRCGIPREPPVDSEGRIYVRARFHVYPKSLCRVFRGEQRRKFCRKVQAKDRVQLREFH